MDQMIDMFQNFVANPSPYMEAFGIREKRDTKAGFKQFPIPFIGTEVGIKYADPSDRRKGGEAYLHVDDLQNLVPRAHSKMVKLHIKFDGGASGADGLFNAEIDYHLEHKDGDGIEEGSMKVVRNLEGGKWHTHITTEAHPFSGKTIIPSRINNMDLEIESDRKTMLNAKYINVPMNRDISVNVVRVPGKSIKAIIVRGGVTSTIEGVLTKKGNEVDIDITGDIRGTKITGKISGKMDGGKGTKLKVDFKKGAETVLQLSTEVQFSGTNFRVRGKYAIMGGKVASGSYSGKYKDGKAEFEAEPFKLKVELHPGKSIKVVASKAGVEMWTYETLRENKSNDNQIMFEAQSTMTLNPDSKLYALIDREYAFGAWKSRTNKLSVFVDKTSRNTIFRKFKIDFDIVKDGAKVFDINMDTTATPYKMVMNAPHLFEKMGIEATPRTLTINHQKGSSLVIDYTGLGGIHLGISHSPNSLGGRHINIVATRAGAQTFKYTGETSKVNNAAMLKVGLKGEFELSQESVLYKKIVGKYRILTPFKKRNSDLEFFWDKQNKNALINKFYAKAKIDKDGTNVANIDISTNEKPYKFFVFLPAVLHKIRPDMNEIDVTVDHNAGQSLEMKVLHKTAKFKGFKIAKTGNGNEREVEWNGKKLVTGDYELTDSRFKTTQSLPDGKSLTTTITWKNKWDTKAFLLDNKVHVNLDGTERKLDLNMEWGMSKIPDLDLNTPDSAHMKMTAVGHNKRWGDYSVSRDVNFSSADKKLVLKWVGDSEFTLGPMAQQSPIKTIIDLTFDVAHTDLVGQVMKNAAGKEYSFKFNKGMGFPSIKIGA